MFKSYQVIQIKNIKLIENNGLEAAFNSPVSKMELHFIVILKRVIIFIIVKQEIGL